MSTYQDRVVFIGPDLKQPTANVDFCEDERLLPEWKKAAADLGLKCRIGRWMVPGKPVAVLVDFAPFFEIKDNIYAEAWDLFRVDSIKAYGDYDEASMFSYAAGRSRVIFHLANFNLTLLVCFKNRVDERRGGFAIGNLANDERFIIEFFDFRTHFHSAPTHTIIIARHVDRASRLKVGIEVELFAMQIFNSCVAEFAKIMWLNFSRQTYGNTFCALCQEQGKLHGQRYRFFFAAVVRHFPLSGLRVE